MGANFPFNVAIIIINSEIAPSHIPIIPVNCTMDGNNDVLHIAYNSVTTLTLYQLLSIPGNSADVREKRTDPLVLDKVVHVLSEGRSVLRNAVARTYAEMPLIKRSPESVIVEGKGEKRMTREKYTVRRVN